MTETMDNEEEVLYDNDECAPIGHSKLIPPVDLTDLLWRAITEDNVAELQHCLHNNHDVNLVDNTGDMCLHTAVRYRSLNSLRHLTSLKETRLDIRNKLGKTPLLLAVNNDAPTVIVRHLISCKCDVNIGNHNGMTPLHAAVQKQHSHIARMLIEGGADVNAQDMQGLTPLHEAVRYGTYETVCMLLYYNASVNEISTYGLFTPFFFAIGMKKSQIAELLVDYVDDFSLRDRDGKTAFFLALHNGMSVALDIVERGGDVHEIHDGMPLIFMLSQEDSFLFSKLWAKVHVKTLFAFGLNHPFLLYLLRISPHLSNKEVLSVLETLFTADDYCYDYNICGIYTPVYELCEDADARLKWTWMLLSHAVPVGADDIEYLYVNYGFCPEIVAIFSSETVINANCHDAFIQQLIYNKILPRRGVPKLPSILDLVHKKRYVGTSKGCVPSLIQIARDVCRKVIYEKHLKVPNYMVYNAIRLLDVPNWVKDVLLLKQAIYA